MSNIPSNAAVSHKPLELAWGDISVLLAVCRSGSLSGAARLMGQNHSTIFRKINAIESKTGVRFFERLPDGYAMTDAGRSVLRYAERIEGEVHALSREVLGQDMRLQGKVRVTAPEGFTVKFAPALFADFMRKHPEVVIDIVGGSSAVDLTRREADIAIRATTKPPDTSLGRKVCAFRFAAYATPIYAEQHRNIPLQEQNWSFIQGTVAWLVPILWKKQQHGESRTVFSSSNALAVQNAAAEGMGFTFLPCYLGDSDERLVRVIDPLESLTLELWLLTHPDLRHTARVKALMTYLYDELKGMQELFAGKKSRGGMVVKYSI